MSFLEVFLLELGCSWFWSKLLPYLIFPCIGLGLGWMVVSRIRKSSGFIKLIVLIALSCAFFFIYFAYSPIYEGDFDNKRNEFPDKSWKFVFPTKQVTIISIPGCPFCYEAMDKLLILKKRVPELRIVYEVITNSPDDLTWYRQKGRKEIVVRKAKQPEVFIQLAKTGFPTYVFNPGKGSIFVWSNKYFGRGALDEIESMLR